MDKELREKVAMIVAKECGEPEHAGSIGYLQIADKILALPEFKRLAMFDELVEALENILVGISFIIGTSELLPKTLPTGLRDAKEVLAKAKALQQKE